LRQLRAHKKGGLLHHNLRRQQLAVRKTLERDEECILAGKKHWVYSVEESSGRLNSRMQKEDYIIIYATSGQQMVSQVHPRIQGY
jgi:hypothetical protein